VDVGRELGVGGWASDSIGRGKKKCEKIGKTKK